MKLTFINNWNFKIGFEFIGLTYYKLLKYNEIRFMLLGFGFSISNK
jgi:hypothetical protein